MIKNYLKIALRNLQKQKLYSIINIGGLALGMATAVLLILWVFNEFTYDDYHAKSKDIYRVTSHLEFNKGQVNHWGSTPMPLAEELKDNYSEISEVTRLYQPWDDVNVRIGNDLLSIEKLLYVDNNWFNVFDYEVLEGSLRDLKSNKNAIAITKSKAKELFGNDAPIDKIIQLDSISLIVKTVLADYPPNTNFKYDVYVQNTARWANKSTFENDNNWYNFNYQTFVVCNNQSNITKLEKKITAHFLKVREDKEANELKLQSLSAIHYDDSIEIGELLPPVSKKVLYIFAGIALLILLTACINYINLTTATLSLRNKEVSIKKFMGVSKGGLFYQFFTESVLTSLLATLLAIGFIYLGLPTLEAMVENNYNIATNSLVWQILAGITLLTILLNGIYPSVLLANLKPLELIKGKAVIGTQNSVFRKALVTFQFSFTIALLICTSLIYMQLKFIQNKDLGYNKEQVFSITIPWYADKTGENSNRIFAQLQKDSKVLDITRSSGNIVNFNSTHSGSLDWVGREKDWKPTVSPMSVSDNYQSFFNLQLKSGRWFSSNNSADNNHVILNETAVNEFKLQEPVVGKKFTYQGNTGQVIAVVKDFHFKSPREKITPLLFFRNNNRQSMLSIKAASKYVSGAISSAEQAWKANIPNMPFKYEFLDDTFQKLHGAEAKQLNLFYAFGGIVLLLSCVGLFGLATFAAEVRFKEIGIRKVLGASIAEILNLLSKDFLKLIFISTFIASPLAWWVMNNWLQNFAYHIDIHWSVFILAGIFVSIVALLTVSYQALKASLMNPVKSLKSE